MADNDQSLIDFASVGVKNLNEYIKLKQFYGGAYDLPNENFSLGFVNYFFRTCLFVIAPLIYSSILANVSNWLEKNIFDVFIYFHVIVYFFVVNLGILTARKKVKASVFVWVVLSLVIGYLASLHQF